MELTDNPTSSEQVTAEHTLPDISQGKCEILKIALP